MAQLQCSLVSVRLQKSIDIVHGRYHCISEDFTIEIDADLLSRVVIVRKYGESRVKVNDTVMKIGKDYVLSEGDRLVIGNVTYTFMHYQRAGPSRVTVEPVKRKNDVLVEEPVHKLNNIKSWTRKANDILVFSHEGLISQQKIAAFDLDGTLIKLRLPKSCSMSGAGDYSDWKLFHDCIPMVLQRFYEIGYKIVIFCEQLIKQITLEGIQLFTKQIENIVHVLNVPLQMFICLGRSYYLKPSFGMWQALQFDYNSNVPINLSESFYVGDSAGRSYGWTPGQVKDISSSDRLFALNIGIKFFTPEEFFMGSPCANYRKPIFHPHYEESKCSTFRLRKYGDIILMVGPPCSGKTLFCKNILIPNQYKYINRNRTVAWASMMEKIERAIQTQRNIVVDHMNHTIEVRSRYLTLAKKYGVDVRCFVMEFHKEHCMHNSRYRYITEKDEPFIHDITMSLFFRYYERPALIEGFSDIIHIYYNPTFPSSHFKSIYYQYLIDI